MFADEQTKKKAFFTYRLNSTLLTIENYGTRLSGLWIGGGVADKNFEYQLIICDDSFYSGFIISGFLNCFKQCYNWCGDKTSPFFRTAASSAGYSGVAFNVNGHCPLNNRLISAGLR